MIIDLVPAVAAVATAVISVASAVELFASKARRDDLLDLEREKARLEIALLKSQVPPPLVERAEKGSASGDSIGASTTINAQDRGDHKALPSASQPNGQRTAEVLSILALVGLWFLQAIQVVVIFAVGPMLIFTLFSPSATASDQYAMLLFLGPLLGVTTYSLFNINRRIVKDASLRKHLSGKG